MEDIGWDNRYVVLVVEVRGELKIFDDGLRSGWNSARFALFGLVDPSSPVSGGTRSVYESLHSSARRMGRTFKTISVYTDVGESPQHAC